MSWVVKNKVGAIQCEHCDLYSVFPTIFANKHELEYDVEKFCNFIGIPYILEEIEEYLTFNSKMVESYSCIKCNFKYGRIN